MFDNVPSSVFSKSPKLVFPNKALSLSLSLSPSKSRKTREEMRDPEREVGEPFLHRDECCCVTCDQLVFSSHRRPFRMISRPSPSTRYRHERGQIQKTQRQGKMWQDVYKAGLYTRQTRERRPGHPVYVFMMYYMSDATQKNQKKKLSPVKRRTLDISRLFFQVLPPHHHQCVQV